MEGPNESVLPIPSDLLPFDDQTGSDAKHLRSPPRGCCLARCLEFVIPKVNHQIRHWQSVLLHVSSAVYAGETAAEM